MQTLDRLLGDLAAEGTAVELSRPGTSGPIVAPDAGGYSWTAATAAPQREV